MTVRPNVVVIGTLRGPRLAMAMQAAGRGIEASPVRTNTKRPGPASAGITVEEVYDEGL
jgi:hypothetical protein